MKNASRYKMCIYAVDNLYYRFESSITLSFIHSDRAALVTTEDLTRYHDVGSLRQCHIAIGSHSPDNRQRVKEITTPVPAYRTEFCDYKEQVISCLGFIPQIAEKNKEIATKLLDIAQKLALHLKGDATANPIMPPDDPDNQLERLALAIKLPTKF